MTHEWLEEQLTKALDEANRLTTENEDLKEIIYDLLPITENDKCIMCEMPSIPIEGFHEDSSLCLDHEFFDRARKVLDL